MHCTTGGKTLRGILFSLSLFAGGYVAGQNRFGQPKTIIHVVEIKWNPGVPYAEKQQVLAGIKDMAGKNSGHQEYLAASRSTRAARFQCRAMPSNFATALPPMRMRKARPPGLGR